MPKIHYVVCRSSEGGWTVKRDGELTVSIYAKTKKEAIKVGRILSIKHSGQLMIADKTTRNASDASTNVIKGVTYG